jgi:hypothetical protein
MANEQSERFVGPNPSSELNTYKLQAMHQGVIRDMEQQRLRQERRIDFEMQRALEQEYKKVQTVKDTTTEAPLQETR